MMRNILVIMILFILLGLLVFVALRQDKFGAKPQGERLLRIQKSKNFVNGSFQNLSETPAFGPGYNFFTVLWDFLFKSYPNTQPTQGIPHVQTNLKDLGLQEDLLVWFGHSSYYFQLAGKRYLVDPVFSANASPIAGTTKAFDGANTYQARDMPAIDYLFISHDHYDHLDHQTILQLKSKVKHVITGLGVGAHLELWGFDPQQITELDWYEQYDLPEGGQVVALPTRHFSGRTFKRNTTLWTSFALLQKDYKLYIGGDSGYDKHFKNIGDQYGPFDLAIIENGQYNEKWPYIHLLPEQQGLVMQDLRAKRYFPVHSSKFKLGSHPWNEPLEKIIAVADSLEIDLVTPKIGEILWLGAEKQVFEHWWKRP